MPLSTERAIALGLWMVLALAEQKKKCVGGEEGVENCRLDISVSPKRQHSRGKA